MMAFLKRNGGWLLVALVMLTLLIVLPTMDNLEVKFDVRFSVMIENHATNELDGVRMKWNIDGHEGVTDQLNHEDLVLFPLQIGQTLCIDFTKDILKDVDLPGRMHTGFAVIDLISTKQNEIVVEGTADLDVEEGGEYYFVLEGHHGS